MSWLVYGDCRGAAPRNNVKRSLASVTPRQHVWSAAIVAIVGRDAAGQVCGHRTGFFVDALGHVVTSVDLFAGTGCTQATVFIRSGPYTVSELYGVDVERGLAVLRVESAVSDAPHAYLNVCRLDLTAGQRLRIFGYVQGRQRVSEHVVTRMTGEEGQIHEVQVSPSIDVDCMGAPVCTETGQVVGLAVCPTNAPGVTIVVPQPPLTELLHHADHTTAMSDAARYCLLEWNRVWPQCPAPPVRLSALAAQPATRSDTPHPDEPHVAVADSFGMTGPSAEMSNLSP